MFKDIILGMLLCFALFYPSVVTQEQPKVLTKEEQRDVLRETQCVKTALYYEVRGEPKEGILAVLSVIQNRTKHKNYPSTFCGVIKQPYQFSYYNTIKHDRTHYKPSEAKVRATIASLAFEATQGAFKSILEPSVVFYHTASIKNTPEWSKRAQEKIKIGRHIFIKYNKG
jgi:spore germination cell wall hydrolase CwlJ-like protein